ncbi:hypothetical protein J7M07_01710 [bacterium]|nr:hypothetical protein [bacterium]
MEIDQDQEEKLTFKRVRLGDNLYMFNKDEILPRIIVRKITKIILFENKGMQIECQYGNFYYEFSVEAADESEHYYAKNNIFLYEKVCDKKFEEFCIERIVDLAKTIGNISDHKLDENAL